MEIDSCVRAHVRSFPAILSGGRPWKMEGRLACAGYNLIPCHYVYEANMDFNFNTMESYCRVSDELLPQFSINYSLGLFMGCDPCRLLSVHWP